MRWVFSRSSLHQAHPVRHLVCGGVGLHRTRGEGPGLRLARQRRRGAHPLAGLAEPRHPLGSSASRPAVHRTSSPRRLAELVTGSSWQSRTRFPPVARSSAPGRESGARPARRRSADPPRDTLSTALAPGRPSPGIQTSWSGLRGRRRWWRCRMARRNWNPTAPAAPSAPATPSLAGRRRHTREPAPPGTAKSVGGRQ